jgi:predicted ATPase
VWWAELAPVHDAGAIVGTVLAAAGGFESTERTPLDQLVIMTADTPTLLVLDNCEHVIDTCAELSAALLAKSSGASILATSREPLAVPGEVVWRVPSLPLSPPVREEPITAAALSQFDAVRLFADRARRARPNFSITDENAPAVAEICHRLDGIALAIELAAARCRAISVERLAAELDDRFRVLGGGTLLPRQQTLLASVEWSHQADRNKREHSF